MANQKEVAEHLDLSERQIRNLIKAQVLPASKGRGGYKLDDCRVAYIRHLRSQSKRSPEPETEQNSNPDSYEYQRLRLTKNQADQLELKNEMTRAKVIPVDLLSRILSKVAGESSGILDTVPLQIKRKHPTLEPQIIEDLKWHCVKAQNAIARLDDVTEEVIDEYVASLDD